MKRFQWILCAPLLLTAMLTAHAAPKVIGIVEQGAETQSLDIFLTSPTTGRIVTSLCDYCEQLTLQVDARTAVFHGTQPVTLRAAADRRDDGATVFFDPDTLHVTRIVLWTHVTER